MSLDIICFMKNETKTYIILLRGIMPVGKNKVPMSTLRTILSAAGLKDAWTFIQSGNVIARSNLDQTGIEDFVHKEIQNKIGPDITVIARTVEQFQEICRQNPFVNVDTARVYFTVLASPPDSVQLKNFLSTDFSPEKIQVIGDTIYTLYNTKYSDSKFTNNFFENKLKIKATTRNFNTMNQLVELAK